MPGTLDETVDIHCVSDFLAHMPTVRGRTALAHRIARRWTTPRGLFVFWPDFGTDLRKFLLGKPVPSRVAQEAEAEAMNDEQVEAIEVAVSDIDLAKREMTITGSVTDADGEFTFTMKISEAAATLIGLQQGT